jgi:hypothetical protein
MRTDHADDKPRIIYQRRSTVQWHYPRIHRGTILLNTAAMLVKAGQNQDFPLCPPLRHMKEWWYITTHFNHCIRYTDVISFTFRPYYQSPKTGSHVLRNSAHLATRKEWLLEKLEFHVFMLLTPCHITLRHNPEDRSMKMNRSISTTTSSLARPNQRHLV